MTVYNSCFNWLMVIKIWMRHPWIPLQSHMRLFVYVSCFNWWRMVLLGILPLPIVVYRLYGLPRCLEIIWQWLELDTFGYLSFNYKLTTWLCYVRSDAFELGIPRPPADDFSTWWPFIFQPLEYHHTRRNFLLSCSCVFLGHYDHVWCISPLHINVH